MNNHLALSNLGASEIWTKGNITEDNYETNVVCENKPLWSDFIAERDRLDALDVANQYQIDRQSAYASIQEQLDMQYWDSVNGTTTWADHIAQVKSDNPKPA